MKSGLRRDQHFADPAQPKLKKTTREIEFLLYVWNSTDMQADAGFHNKARGHTLFKECPVGSETLSAVMSDNQARTLPGKKKHGKPWSSILWNYSWWR